MSTQISSIGMCGNRLFTLIEMLIVIAIIGILASLLMSSLQRTLSSARTIQCANNMKSFYQATLMFTDDYQGFLPPIGVAVKTSDALNVLFPETFQLTGGPYKCWWMKTPSNCFWPYLDPLQNSYCPDHPLKDAFYSRINGYWNSYKVPYNHFSNTSYVNGQAYSVRRRLAQRPHPSKLFMYLDMVTPDYGMSYTSGHYANIGWFHNLNSGFNANFFDGHIRVIPLSWTPLDRYDMPFEQSNWN